MAREDNDWYYKIYAVVGRFVTHAVLIKVYHYQLFLIKNCFQVFEESLSLLCVHTFYFIDSNYEWD